LLCLMVILTNSNHQHNGMEGPKRLNVKLILKSIYIYIYIYICVCVCVCVCARACIFSILDFEVEISMYNKCQYEVAIFAAWWEICLSHFNRGETDSKTEVKWYWRGKLNYLEKTLCYFIHLPPVLYIILAIYSAVKWNSSFHHFGYAY
jgi:hypothetical protein